MLEGLVSSIARVNAAVNGFVWGPVMLAAILGVGLMLTVRMRGFQVMGFRRWWRETAGSLIRPRAAAKAGSIPPFQAVTTALAGTVGTGNIVGVASALALGGPGAIFWMWVSAALGMMTSFAEKSLCIKYRVRSEAGVWVGGPMAYIERGLGRPRLAAAYALLCASASLGMGNMVQANAVSSAMAQFGAKPAATGLVMAALAALVIVGGIRRIGSLTEKLVPAMVALYSGACIICLVLNAGEIPDVLRSIVREAFRPAPVVSGGVGYGMMLALRMGVSRGVFSNEAGLGSSSIAHAAADTEEPAQQGMWGMFEVFVDTIVMCTLTALVIMTSGTYEMDSVARLLRIGEAVDQGANATIRAMSCALGNGAQWLIAVSLAVFAFSTLVGWSYFGERSVEHVFGRMAVPWYRALFVAAVFLGAVCELTLAWSIADTLNGLMAVPNLIAVAALSGEAAAMLNGYLRKV